ncbi:MAG: dockerin type I repeat-containing protein [Candidatus Omnitrophica bacterium]|nr:dockerin type I repeat-containing protein [Candidatus Omnitrophota bacterium]
MKCWRMIVMVVFCVLSLLGLGHSAWATDPLTLIDPQSLTVSGSVTPDVTGAYVLNGKYNGRNYYTHNAGASFIWWRTGSWVISDKPPTVGSWASKPNSFWVSYRRNAVSGPFSWNAAGAGIATVSDPNAMQASPQTFPDPVFVPGDYVTPQVQISGALTPDASGTYNLQSDYTCNNLPVWKRDDGNYYFQYNSTSSAYITSSASRCVWAKRGWEWNSGKIFDNPSAKVYTGYAGTASLAKVPDPKFPTPAQYLASQPPPVFKKGHTLPPLTRFGWTFSYDMTRVMADWGYAFDLGDASANLVADAANPDSRTAKIINLVAKDPVKYKLCVNMDRIQDTLGLPESTYMHAANGVRMATLVSSKFTGTRWAWADVFQKLIANNWAVKFDANTVILTVDTVADKDRLTQVFGSDDTVMIPVLQKTLSLGTLTKKLLASPLNADAVWSALLAAGYIDQAGEILVKFCRLENVSGMILPSAFDAQKDLIFSILTKARTRSVWSPEAPDSISASLAAMTGNNLKSIAAKAPISIVLNGGERGIGVYGWDGLKWKLDPAIMTVKNKGAVSRAAFIAADPNGAAILSGLITKKILGIDDVDSGSVFKSKFNEIDLLHGTAIINGLISRGILAVDDTDSTRVYAVRNNGAMPARPLEISAGAYEDIWRILQQPFDKQVYLIRAENQTIERPVEISGHSFDGIWAVLQDHHYLWSDYESRQKARQEMFFTNAGNAAGDPLYIFYTVNNTHNHDWVWSFDYTWTKGISDLPSTEAYSSSGNATLLGDRSADKGQDLLTYSLTAVGQGIAAGNPLSYNWVCAGWALYPKASSNTAIDRYVGFLKTYYTAGTIGGVAGYFAYPNGAVDPAKFAAADPAQGAANYQSLVSQGVLALDGEAHAYLVNKAINRPTEILAPCYDEIWYLLRQAPGVFDAQFYKDQPPHWLLQIEALSQVHAQFSYLEDILRHGDLLPGQGPSLVVPSQPGYEFATGYDNTRVVARKMQGQKRWLICAWAADGIVRTVDVTIPDLGTISVLARPAASLYDARIVKGSMTMTLMDIDPTFTPLSVPASAPDLDNGNPGVVEDTKGSGDVTGNGAVTMYDAALTLRGVLSPTQRQEADINGDTAIDANDARAIAQKALGL